MSAPAVLDRGALDGGLATRVAPPAWPRPEPTGRLPERRDSGRLRRLTREHDLLCTQAVDLFEIAAGLEAAGINDRHARTDYGVASIFELAEQMFELVPRRPVPVGADVGQTRRHPVNHLLRGVLYGLPALLFVAALRTVHPGPAATVLLISTVTACALGQGLSYLGHLLLGRGARRAPRSLFRGALLAAVTLLAVLAAAGLLLPALSVRVGAFAGGQIVYVVAATVLLTVEADLLLLALLAPAVALAGLELGDPTALPDAVVLTGLCLCLLAVATAAWSRPPAEATGRAQGLRTMLGRDELAVAASFVGYGAASALLLSFVAVDILTGASPASTTTLAVTMLPLIASLGAAEWLQYRLRGRADRALRRSTSIAQFTRHARAELGSTVVGYAAVLAALTGGLLAWLNLTERADPELVTDAAGYATLGLALFLATLLLSCGRYRPAIGLTGAALLLDTGLRWALTATHQAFLLPAAHLAVFGLLSVTLLAVAAVDYGRLGRHR